MSGLRNRAPWLLLVLSAVNPVSAQRPCVETYSLGEGLPSAAIYDLTQDASGRLWIASRGGVASYDGRTFRAVSISEGLPSAVYQGVAADGDGRVWALTRMPARVFLRHEGESWRLLAAPPLSQPERTWATSIAVFSEDGRTRIAVGTTREGLWIWDGSAWQRLGPEEGLPSPTVSDLAPYRGGLAIATAEGLCELRDRRIDCRLRDVDPRLAGSVLALYTAPVPDKVSKLWITGPEWAGCLQGEALELLGESLGLRRFASSNTGAIAVDAAGGVYFGAPNRGWFWDPVERRLIDLGPLQGVSSGISTLLVDRETNVWIGSQRGLTKICSRRFLSFDRSHGLLESEVSAVAESKPGLLVLGHDTGLTLLGPQGALALPFRPAEGKHYDYQRVLDIAVDDRGDVWLAAQAMGLLQLAPDGRAWSAVPGIRIASAVEVDPRGRLWVATPDHLLVREGGEFVRVDLPAEGAELRAFRWLSFSPSGRVYLATRRGLLTSDGEGWRAFHAPTPEADDVYNVLAEPNGDAWVGTAAGLYRLRGERLITAELGGRRLDRPVYQIFEGPLGRIWFGTDDGVWRWDSVELRHLTVRHGLVGRETNRGAGFVDHRGRVWIGTDQGVSVYQEVYDLGPGEAPRLEVRALETSGVSRPFTAPIELSHRQSTFTFHIGLIAFSREEAVEWRYRLEGFDAAWQGPETFREGGIRYTNLPAGRYRLRIAARWAGGGSWGEEVASPEVLLREPLWRRTWFLAATGLAAAVLSVAGVALVVGTTRARARRLEAVNRQLVEQMAEREKVERALRASEARLATLFAAVPDAISLSRLENGVFIDVNEAFARMSGFEREELVGSSSLDIGLWSDPEQRAEVARRLGGGPVHNFEVTFRSKAGDLVICLLSAGIIELEDQRVVVAVLRDITDRKQADDERERLIRELETRQSEIEQFAFTLSHDFKTPLVTVKGFLGLLERDLESRDTERIRCDVDHIRRASDTMGALLDGLLLFLSVDPRAFRRQEVALSDLVRDVLASLAERIDHGDVEVQVEPALPRVVGDPRLLGEALRQLIDNSLIHATGQRATRIEIGSQIADNGCCVVHLRDNGTGIDPRYHEKIFDLFERLDPHSERTGLGLALVRRVVELHGGRIWVESEGGGHGVTFFVALEASQS